MGGERTSPGATRAAVQLALDGQTADLIAARLDLSRARVRTILRAAHAAGFAVDATARAPGAAPAVHVVIGRRVLEALAPHARARALSPDQLAQRLLATVSEGDLVNAVLDDLQT